MSLGFSRELTPITPEIIFYIGDFGVANSTLLIMLIALLFLVIGLFFVPKFSLIPKTFQSIIEIIFESIYDLVKQIIKSDYHTERIFPVIATILVYFAISNVVGIIPGLTDITYNGLALFRVPTSDFNTAFGVSLGAVILLNVVSIQQWGVLGYLGKFFNIKGVIKGFRKSFMKGFIGLVELFVGLLDLIGEVAKVVSLSFRLFGNVYAGQVLTIIIIGAFAWGLPTIWSIMSNFTGLLQGFVFAALITVYYSLTINVQKEAKENDNIDQKKTIN